MGPDPPAHHRDGQSDGQGPGRRKASSGFCRLSDGASLRPQATPGGGRSRLVRLTQAGRRRAGLRRNSPRKSRPRNERSAGRARRDDDIVSSSVVAAWFEPRTDRKSRKGRELLHHDSAHDPRPAASGAQIEVAYEVAGGTGVHAGPAVAEPAGRLAQRRGGMGTGAAGVRVGDRASSVASSARNAA